MVTSSELRTKFLEYFRQRDHEVVASSPLVPGNDPTLLFTNAGMVQFKDVFLGQDKRPYMRATTSQRCVRAGGKHNDLENVGYTARHHTFFEMLGNFSFGDYFKREAIAFAWEFLTKDLGLAAERLWVTVFEEDDEAADIWFKDIGIDPARFSRCGMKDNFWSMGDTGPCGPCSEIFYDHGPEVPGGPPGSPDEDADRYIEIWNLVFMQFNRDESGNMTPLPKPSVDTGMGLERLAAVLQGVHSNYEIDLFQNLIEAAAKITGASDNDDKSLRVVADHIRSCAFLIVDGVVPSNEGRGYVLRRIIRRAVRHGHRLGAKEPFFYRLVEALDREMGSAYPELGKRREVVERVLRQEEERFAETLERGLRILDQSVAELSGDTIPGDVLFRLYDTYGFPVDLTADIARERGLNVDMAGFEAAMEVQRAGGRAASQFEAVAVDGLDIDVTSTFTGYESLTGDGRITALYRDGQPVDGLQAGDDGVVVLDQSPFYAESGGQVGDIGHLRGNGIRFDVRDTQKQSKAILHIGTVGEGRLGKGDSLTAEVTAPTRTAAMRNHTGTHLVHAALRAVLGDHVQQKGSLVAPGRLRFDFSHFEPVSNTQLRAIERMTNEWILDNAEVSTRLMSLDEALDSGALALFGEKYDEKVRVLSVGEHSTELCGGTHVSRAGDIGLFKIVSETGIAAGVRRIEALTGNSALEWVSNAEDRLDRLSALVKSDPDNLEDRVGQVVSRNRELEKELDRLNQKLASNQGGELAERAVEIDGMKVLAAKVDGFDKKSLRNTVDQLKNKLGTGVVVLATVEGEKVSLVAGVTADRTGQVKAGLLVKFVAEQVGGRGGGRPDLAEAGGNNPANIEAALDSVPDWVRKQVAS